MFCRYCGTNLAADARFCEVCGKAMVESDAAATAIPAPAAVVSTTDPATRASVVAHVRARWRSRPAGIILISLLSLISGAICIFASMIFLGGGFTVGLAEESPIVRLAAFLIPAVDRFGDALAHDANMEGLVALLFGIGYLVVAVNLMRLKEVSGRLFAAVFSVAVAVHSGYLIHTGEGAVIWHIISIGFNAWVIYYLFSAKVRKAFALVAA